jgi:hypothetical protein
VSAAVKRQWQASSDPNRHGIHIYVWCPGCDNLHCVEVEGGGGPVWDWDGNLEAPTFSPSILVTGPNFPRCHSFIKAGQWQFLGDCEHALAGQTVPLPPIPEGWFADA